MARLNETIDILKKIKEKYHQYDVEYFRVQQYDTLVGECKVQEPKYCIDFIRRVIYLK